MKNRIKAVVFDLDGTLFDVRELIYKQLQTLTHEFNGQKATRDEIASVLYGTVEVQIKALVNDKRHHSKAMERATDLIIADKGKALPYLSVKDTLLCIKNAGNCMGVLTARPAENLDDLNRHGISSFFGSVVHAGRVEKHKPHPEGLLLAISELGIKPTQTLMVGDTVADIGAGKAAGVLTVGVTHGFGKECDLTAAGADHIIGDIPSLLTVLNLK